MEMLAQSIGEQFTVWDWGVVVGYLIVTTVIGGALAGKQATIRDFFLGGRKLPWYAVTGSIIATEISAVTFVGVPAIMYATSGNFTYLQLGLFGSVIARLVVGFVFVRAYYQREIYSPYDYMSNQLGEQVRWMATCLFSLGGMLAQGARVYLTALILDLIIGDRAFGQLAEMTGTGTMVWSIIAIGIVSVIWTIMGGITTVIWTDVILFLVFFLGGFVALGFVIAELPGSPWESFKHMCRLGYETDEAGPWGKFTFFDFDPSPVKDFTIWTAIIASSWGGLASYGTDQLLAQRMFCCKGPREARLAIIASCAGQIITVTMLFVGLGLFAYYAEFPLSPDLQEMVDDKRDRIFPIFIIEVLPVGITGLLIAGIFAAAISSLDSILAALSQTTISAFYLPWRRRRDGDRALTEEEASGQDRRTVFVSRILVVFWGIVLCLMALVADLASAKFPEILNLALSMAGYAGGALLAGFLLALLPLRIDGRGFLWSAPLSVMFIFAIVWHHSWAQIVCWSAAILILGLRLWPIGRRLVLDATPSGMERREDQQPIIGKDDVRDILLLMFGLGLMLLINYFGHFGADEVDPVTGDILEYRTLAWPWFIPVGSTVAFVWGYLMSGPARPDTAPR